MSKYFRAGVIWLLMAVSPATAQTTIQHNSKVQIKPSGTTTYADALRVWGGGQFGPGGAVQTINIDGSLNINSTTVPSGVITFAMWDDNGCSSGQIPKYNGSAWACDTDLVGGGGGGGTLSSISLVMPSAIFDISPGTLTADGTFTVTFDTQTANYVFAGPTTGSAAAPTFRALVAADLPSSVVLSSDNEVITGAWRFNDNTIFGDSTTAQQLVHIYKATAQAGLSIEKGDETERWDILANTQGLQIVEATGGLVPLTFKNNRIGVFTNSPTAGYEMEINGDLKLSGNISLGSYFENSLIPSTGDTYNIGDVTRPWSQGYISTINSTVFAESTATLFGGYSIIGKNSGTLAAAAASGDTTIYLDKNGTSLPVSGDTWIVIRAHDSSGSVTPKVEYIKLVSVGACSGTAPNLSCPWTVVRDVNSDNATDPAWPVGTPFLFLGSSGDGRIELNAVSGLPRISILRQSTTAATSTDIIRLGGLDGVAGMSSVTGRYGIFIGEGTTNYLKFQKNVGGGVAVGDDDILVVGGTVKAIAGEFGSNASNLVQVSSEGLNVNTGAVHGGKTSYSSSTDGFWIGNDGGSYKVSIGDGSNYLTWDGVSTLTIAGNGAGLTSINGGNIQTDTITATQIAANAITASELAANSITAADILAGTITATQIAADTITGNEIVGTTLSAITADLGTITAGTLNGATMQTIANCGTATTACVKTDSSGIKWYNNTPTLLGSLTGSGIALTTSVAGVADAQRSYAFTTTGVGSGDSTLYSYSNGTSFRQLGLYNLVSTSGWYGKTVLTGGASDSYGQISLDGQAGTAGNGQILVTSTDDVWFTMGGTVGLVLSPTNSTFYTNFIVDTDTLYIDVAFDRVGINDATPSYPLDITGETRIAGQLVVTGSLGNSTYIDATYGNTINFAIDSNANNAGWINYRGYAGGTTQFRDLYIGDGKGNPIAVFDGSDGTIDINELTTTSAMYPFVSDGGIIRAKSDGVNATVTCTAGSNIVFVVEYGIVTSITGSGCS